MSTTSVPYVSDNKVGAIQMPNYAYPSHGRVKLVAVKQDILTNPYVPTIRSMDRDNVLQKLADEHCRTSTVCTMDDFNSFASRTVFGKQEKPPGFSCLNMPDIKDKVEENFSAARQLRTSFNYNDFSAFLNSTACCRPHRLPPLSSAPPRDVQVFGYAPQIQVPDHRHSWRFTLRAAHEIDDRGRKPFPADMLKQYRDTHSKTGVCMAPRSWHA